MTQQRAFFRLRYPITMRPQLLCRDRTFPVAELSERGIRIEVTSPAEFTNGWPVTGLLRFDNGGMHLVDGHVSRIDEKEIVVLLSSPVSLSRILEEQRHIRRFSGRIDEPTAAEG